MPRRCFLLALFLVACTPARPVTVATETAQGIAIDATATLYVPPDRAAISLTFTHRGDTLGPAHRAVTQDRRAFESALPEGVRVELGPLQYAPYTRRDARLERFQASQTVVVHTSELDGVPSIIDLAGESLSEVRVRHYVSDPTAHRGELRTMAIEAAHQKAGDLAAGFEVELGDVLSVEEGGAHQGDWGISNSVRGNVFARVNAEASETPPPGSIPMQVTLRVRYALAGPI